MVYCDHASVLHCYGDIAHQRKWDHDLDYLGSHNHSTRGGPFSMGGPLWLCICLALLWKYSASKLDIGGQTHAQMLRWFYTLSNAMRCI